MNGYLNNLTSNIVSVVTVCFFVIIFFTLLKFLIKGDNNQNNLQKIIGGLSVFIVAILANNAWVFSLSIFVGGLIIASEDFMKFLAAIMKSAGDKIPETVNAFNTFKATKSEVNEKVKEENNAIIATTSSSEVSLKFGSNEYTNERIRKVKKIEGLVHSFLKNYFKDDYQIQMKLENKQGSIIVDGLVVKFGDIQKIIEIRFITAKSFPNLKHLIHRFTKKLKDLEIKKKILFVVVSEELTKETALEMQADSPTSVEILFIKYLIDETIQPVLLPKSLDQLKAIV